MGFLDSVSAGLNRGKDVAARQTEKAKFTYKINELNRQRQNLAAQLGASLYDVTKECEEFRTGREALYDGIAELDALRLQYQQEIERLEQEEQIAQNKAAVYRCHRCGAQVAATDLFCSGCGLPAEEIKAEFAKEHQSQEKACPQCGKPVLDSDDFCIACGTPLAKKANVDSLEG